MADQKILVYLCLLLASVTVVYAAKPQPGKFSESINGSVETIGTQTHLGFSKILSDKTKIKLIVTSLDCDKDISATSYKIQWNLRYTACSDVYLFVDNEDLMKLWNSSYCAVVLKEEDGHVIKTLTSLTQTFNCNNPLSLEDMSTEPWTPCIEKKPDKNEQAGVAAKPANSESNHSNKANGKRDVGKNGKTKDGATEKKKTENKPPKVTTKTENKPKVTTKTENKPKVTTKKLSPTTKKPTVETALTTEKTLPSHVVAISPNAGPFLLNVKIESTETDKDKHPVFRIKVEAEFIHHTKGYLSAHDWPMLVFYGVMCGVYCLFAFAWLISSACVWNDLLRIQFWIGGVIFLSLIEMVAFYAVYHHVFVTGVNSWGVLIFAELISALRRSVARMLVVIISLGFGIIKPWLGSTVHKVLLAAGALYFVLAAIEGCMRATHELNDTNSLIMIAGIPLAVLDIIIFSWVVSGLIKTIRMLRLHHNPDKLSLYKYFASTMIFCVVATIIFIVWSLKTLKTNSCLTDWQELWVDDAFWHLLFCVLLMVIMVLWCPTTNNQRYAYSPFQNLLEVDMDNKDDGEKMKPSDVPFQDLLGGNKDNKGDGEKMQPSDVPFQDLLGGNKDNKGDREKMKPSDVPSQDLLGGIKDNKGDGEKMKPSDVPSQDLLGGEEVNKGDGEKMKPSDVPSQDLLGGIKDNKGDGEKMKPSDVPFQDLLGGEEVNRDDGEKMQPLDAFDKMKFENVDFREVGEKK